MLLWRGVLRIANEDLQDLVLPSKLKWSKKRVLAPRVIKEIKILEEKDNIDAVDKLVEKLLEVEKSDWPDLFLKSLEPQYPKVASSLRRLAEELNSDIFADASFIMEDDGHEAGEILVLSCLWLTKGYSTFSLRLIGSAMFDATLNLVTSVGLS